MISGNSMTCGHPGPVSRITENNNKKITKMVNFKKIVTIQNINIKIDELKKGCCS